MDLGDCGKVDGYCVETETSVCILGIIVSSGQFWVPIQHRRSKQTRYITSVMLILQQTLIVSALDRKHRSASICYWPSVTPQDKGKLLYSHTK